MICALCAICGSDYMTTMTLSIPDELKRQMEVVPEMNWSEIARQAFSQKLKEWQLFQSIVSKSRLTEKDALEIGRKVNAGLAKRHVAK